MARPIEEGLSYFSLDVDFYDDPKIILIEEKFGIKGGYIANRLLCWVYRNGYYLRWDSDMALVFAKRVGNGVTSALVSDVVNALVRCSFFDEGMFHTSSVLTSRGIQKRWSRVITDARRKASINPLYALVNVDDSELMREETIGKRPESTQSKVKYSKEKKRDKSRAETPEPINGFLGFTPPVAPPPSNGPPFEDVHRWFRGAGGTKEMAEKFYNKWDSVGWIQNGSRIVRWAGLAGNFIVNYKENEKRNGGKQTTTDSINSLDAAAAELLRDINAPDSEQ